MAKVLAIADGYFNQTGVLSAAIGASKGVDLNGHIVVLRPLLSATDTSQAMVCSSLINTLSTAGGGIGVTLGGGDLTLAGLNYRFVSVGPMERTGLTGIPDVPRGAAR